MNYGKNNKLKKEIKGNTDEERWRLKVKNEKGIKKEQLEKKVKRFE